MINDYYSLDFLGNSWKNNCNKIFTSYWKAQGFDSCKCESHRKLVLGRDESLPNTVNLLSNRSNKEDEL
jgi:hypothetical protein